MSTPANTCLPLFTVMALFVDAIRTHVLVKSISLKLAGNDKDRVSINDILPVFPKSMLTGH